MPSDSVYWTRKLELQLVEYVRQRECIWKPGSNTNYQIQQKYRAYAEIAARLGRGFTARKVRARWVNIRSTFNQNLRKMERSRQSASSPSKVYVPCWPLWKPLQFLRNDGTYENETDLTILNIKTELELESEEPITVRQRVPRTNRPRVKLKPKPKECIKVLDNLIASMKPVLEPKGSYWYFGKHVTERLKAMREIDAECASREILEFMERFETDFDDEVTVKDEIYNENELLVEISSEIVNDFN